MISGIKSCSVALTPEAVLGCCEEVLSTDKGSDLMCIELFGRIIQVIARNKWGCRVLASRGSLPAAYVALCREVRAELVVPNDYEGVPIDCSTVVVVDQRAITALNTRLSPARVILRVRRAGLGDLAAQVQSLLERVPAVSLRHPELLGYTDADLLLYQEQLEVVGRWLLKQGSQWNSFRVDCLTDGVRGKGAGHCEAGNEHIAVDSRGAAYICMAFQHSHPSVGSFPDAIEISDRHLLTREYSLACKSCSVDYCLRCVYQNKVDTRECCVSAANVCKLAHVEQRARAALAQEAKQNGCWKADWREPLAPSTLDPFESIEAQREPFMPLWQQPWLTATQPEDVSPGSMLEIIHELEGIVRAVYRCVQENVDIPHNYLLADTPLSRARARTLEGYRDVRFGPGCPTIREIESAALGGTCSERTETCRGADSHSSSCWS